MWNLEEPELLKVEPLCGTLGHLNLRQARWRKGRGGLSRGRDKEEKKASRAR